MGMVEVVRFDERICVKDRDGEAMGDISKIVCMAVLAGAHPTRAKIKMATVRVLLMNPPLAGGCITSKSKHLACHRFR